MSSKHWLPLKKGDIVDVIAPGYACKKEELQRAIEFIKSWELVPRVPTDILKPHLYHAQTDEKRFIHLKKALQAKDSTAVWCLRGGYGSNRLVPMLEKLTSPTRVKLFVGISDITSLHSFLNKKWNWPTIHGPLLDRLGNGLIEEEHLLELKALCFGQLDEMYFSKLKPLNLRAKKVRKLNTKICGGNLSVLQGHFGTPAEVDIKNHLLFLEDIGERGYRIDRMLEHLRQAYNLKTCAGIILGDFIGGSEPDGRSFVQQALQRFADFNELPVWSGLPAGHGVIQRPVPLNTQAVLEQVGSKYSLLVKTGKIEL